MVVRDALDADLPAAKVAERVAELPPGPARALGERWLAQLDLLGGRLPEARTRLEGVADETALDAILRGRLALLQGQTEDAEAQWTRAGERFPVIDGMRLELASFLFGLGDDVAGQANLANLIDSGTRLSSAWYTTARLLAIDGRSSEAASTFRVGWNLEPKERAEVVSDPVHAYLAGQAELVEALTMGPVAEPPRPAARPRPSDREPLVLPAEAGEAPSFVSASSGELLRVARGGFELLLPGTAALAPASNVVESPADRRRAAEQRALELVSAARAELSTSAILTSPALRDRIEVAAVALARRGDWPTLLELTSGLEADREIRVPAQLARLRAEALRRAGKLADSRAILVRVASEAVANQRRDPWLYLQLSRLLLDLGAFDDADRAANIGETQLAFAYLDSMGPRIEMERRLAQDFSTHETEHFLLRFPPEAAPSTAATMGEVLEAELKILAPWFAWRPDKATKVEVHLLWFDDFMEHYSIGGTAIASYDGALRLPFAAVKELPPVIHEILVHELVHALLDGATNGRAPSWFHEGLAQHLEPVQHADNLIPDYSRSDRRISIPLVEAVFRGRPRADLVSVAYHESLWVVRYLEVKWGREGVRRLIDALAKNGDHEVALQTALGVDFEELDAAAWQWVLEDVSGGRWKPRAARKVTTKVFTQPVREDAAQGARLTGGAERLQRPSTGLSRQELAALTAALADYETSLVPGVQGLVAWRRARRANDAAAALSACAAIAAAPLPTPPPARSPAQDGLRRRMAKVLQGLDALQGACRRQAWSEVDQRSAGVETAIGEMQAYVDEAKSR